MEMTAMRQPGEPSVEEILESIKKVIAHDTRAGETRRQRAETVVPAPAPAPVAQQPVEESYEDDVLDLAASARFLDDVDAEADEVPIDRWCRTMSAPRCAIAGRSGDDGPARRPAADRAQRRNLA
jgi:hypothetical protein